MAITRLAKSVVDEQMAKETERKRLAAEAAEVIAIALLSDLTVPPYPTFVHDIF
jgi:hypothetical protein